MKLKSNLAVFRIVAHYTKNGTYYKMQNLLNSTMFILKPVWYDEYLTKYKEK